MPRTKGTDNTKDSEGHNSCYTVNVMRILRKLSSGFSAKNVMNLSLFVCIFQFEEILQSWITRCKVRAVTYRGRVSIYFSAIVHTLSITASLQHDSPCLVQPAYGENLFVPSSRFSFKCNLSSPLCLTTRLANIRHISESPYGCLCATECHSHHFKSLRISMLFHLMVLNYSAMMGFVMILAGYLGLSRLWIRHIRYFSTIDSHVRRAYRWLEPKRWPLPGMWWTL